MQIANDELNYCKEVLMEEMSTIKSWAMSLERKMMNNEALNKTRAFSNDNDSRIYTDTQKTLSNYKDIIFKIDNKVKEEIYYSDGFDRYSNY